MGKPLLDILLVDDHELVRSGLRMVFEGLSAVDTVFEASSGETCIDLVRELPIDIVFMDMGLPGMDGLSTSLRLLQIDEDMKIVILTGLQQRPLAHGVLQAGIRGYMTKSSAPEEIVEAISSIVDGGTYLSKDIASELAMESLKNKGRISPLDRLSRRELQVALLLMNGHKPSDVGSMLFLSNKTVSTYKVRAFEKLQVDSLVELVELGMENGFLGHTP